MLGVGCHSGVAAAAEEEWPTLTLGGHKASADSVRDPGPQWSAEVEAAGILGKAPVFPSLGASPRTLHSLHSAAVQVVGVAQRLESALEDAEVAAAVES